MSDKRLTKDEANSMFLGVCSGVAKYIELDVTIVRLLAVLSLFISVGATALLYIIAAVVMPEE